MYPDADAVTIMRDSHCAHARYVWNLCVEQESWWRSGRRLPPGWAQRCRQLTEARAEFDWLRAGSVSVQQQALRDFDRAMKAFFDANNPARKPKFRSKRGIQGFVVSRPKVHRLSRRWGEVLVPKVGWVKFRWTRSLPANLGISRITLDQAGRWHISFPSPQPAVSRKPTGAAVGIDRGVRTALVTSAGQHYRVPRMSDRQAQRYLGLQRRLSRQRRRSAKRESTRRAMVILASKAASRRKDWTEKVSTRLVYDHDLIALENLNIRDMTRKPALRPDPEREGVFLPNKASAKAGLNRSILASCWGTLGRRIGQKAAASGVTVVSVDPRFTSQQCRVCGHTNPANRESQAVFRCVSCGHEDHADTNAACNILARGLLLTTGEIVPAHALGHRASRPRQPAQAAAGTTRSAA